MGGRFVLIGVRMKGKIQGFPSRKLRSSEMIGAIYFRGRGPQTG